VEEVEHQPGDAEARAGAVRAVIANVKRLISDAETLTSNGSPGSALSLAILAFEEGGKGHIIELNFQKPKTDHTLHEYRHVMAFCMLAVSLTQKYGLDFSEVGKALEGRYVGLKPGKKFKLPPITDELREQVMAAMGPQLKNLAPAEFLQYGIEMRWLNKIALVVQNGGLEKLRQSGLYLDTDPATLTVTSSPMSIEPLEAQRWVWAATRVLNLLESGIYHQPYSPLSELMEAISRDDEEARSVFEMVRAMDKPEVSRDK
jgi:hypothetical protein